MADELRKGPSGPPADTIGGFPPGSSIRADEDGNLEGVLGALSGQLWYWNGSIWLPTSTAPDDGESPVWNEAANDWEYETIGGGGLSELQPFTNTNSPLELYVFDGTADSLNGRVGGVNLALNAGNLAYADIVPGKTGLFVLAGARYSTAAAVPSFQLTGDMTYLTIVQQDAPANTQLMLLGGYGGPGETQADNLLWAHAFALASLANPAAQQWASEHDAGVNDGFTSGGTASLPPNHNILFAGARRQGNVIQFFLNGLPFGAPSAALTAPNGGNGADCRFTIGGFVTTAAAERFVMFSTKIFSRAITNAEILAEYNATMGPAFGILS